MKIKYNDKELEYEENVNGFKLIEDLNLDNKEIIAMKINDKYLDLNCDIKEDSNVEFITFKDKKGKEIFWHSSSHLMAAAIKKLWPDAKLAIGPAVDDGFYYDIDLDYSITPEDLKKIEKEMKKISKNNEKFIREDLTRNEGLKKAESLDDYKTELINDLPLNETNISFYKLGEFTDLCKGPHVPSSRYIKAIKLTKIAGAYFRGDVKNKQLQRIYGISFPTKEELKEYLTIIEEAKKRDHRILGKKLKLFSFHEEAQGMPFWHNNGLVIFNKLIEFWREEHKNAGYLETKTPIILSRKLWESSGHWLNFKENMYTTVIDDIECAVKPMNCPGGMLMYKEDVHSYRELPLRVGEIGLVHRHELSGVLSGLFRVRQFHQDDAHIFMREDQIKDEIIGVLNLVDKIYSVFGLSYHLELSTRPKKSIGTDEQWEKATTGLKNALDSIKKPYKINEGDGAFYGPKIDIHIKDALKRTWQCGTIQLDMSLPEKFDLKYMGEDGTQNHRPVMIHRVIYGSLERFIGILIEHYAGKFPLWFSPMQVTVLSISDNYNDYAKKIKEKLQSENIRVKLDIRNESISKKVREAQLDKINYILIVGQKEQENNTINIRTRDNEIKGEIAIDEFISNLKKEIDEKK
ncbi:MAG: threonine--tRNA ligase [Candidatus Woesearchaeota archaeon]